MQEVAKSIFNGGRNVDIDRSIIQNSNYVEGRNIILTGDSKFLAAENIRGTLEIDTIISSFSGSVLGVYSNKYNIAGSIKNCLTIFTSQNGGYFKILCYDLDSTTLYELYQESFTAAFEAASPLVDAVMYPESGIDILYFTDGYNEIRKLRCEIPSGASANFLTASDLSLQRRQPRGHVSVTAVSDGGTLSCGTYVLTHRLVNPSKNIYSKWSPFTAPVTITGADLSSSSNSYIADGTTGDASTQQINTSITVHSDEEALYTHYQLGMIERVSGEPQTVLSLLSLNALTGAGLYSPTIKDNSKISTTDISEIVIDDAAIKSVKTLQIKNNKLFGGNVTYHTLEFDNGTPSVSAGSIVKQTSGTVDFMSHPTNSSRYKGYFRDEVYRFGVVYYDKYGNYSDVKPLDMSSVTDNTFSGSGFKDMKFPARRSGSSYHVFASGGTLQSLGLSLTITNHPTWAVGFIVVRAKRKKNIVTQTPLLDVSELDGVEVVGEYPTKGLDQSTSAEKEYTDASPMNPLGTLAPKNLFWLQRRHIVENFIDTDPKQKGETQWGDAQVFLSNGGKIGSPTSYSCIFPQDDMLVGSGFEDKKYTYEMADIAWLRLKKTSNSGTTYTDGDHAGVDIHGTFYADQKGDYFCSANTISLTSASPLDTPTGTILNYKLSENYSNSTTIGSYFFQVYTNLITSGLPDNFQVAPDSSRMGVVKFRSPRSFAIDTYLGTISAPSGQSIPSAFSTGTTRNNGFSFTTTSYTESTQYANIVEIVNITNGLDDSRYGDEDDTSEFISTGAIYDFSDNEITNNLAGTPIPADITVFGGDCTVSLHSFKVTNSYFGVVNNEKFTTGTATEALTVSKWKRSFDNKHDKPVSYPSPYKACSTVLSVVLESEYLAPTQTSNPLGFTTGAGGFQIPYSASKGVRKIPFAYGYNNNYNIENIEKIFTPTFIGKNIIETFKARGVYSDQKVYQTGIFGFDRFRALNIFDLEETYGGITKFALAGDQMIAIQERSVAYVPVDAEIIETADATSLAIRSSEIVGIPIYISRLYGSNHLKSVLTIDRSVFFADNRNQAVFKLTDAIPPSQTLSLEPLSEKGAIGTFNNWFTSPVTELYGAYDSIKRHYWLFSSELTEGDNMMCEVWDDRLGAWIGQFEFASANRLYDMVTANGKVYVLGKDTDLKLYQMYAGTYNSLCGATITPKIKFVVNDQFEIPKTFDNFVVYSSDKLDTVSIQAEKETGVTGNEVTGISLNKDRREGSYRVQIPYDVNDARVRGTRADVTLIWPTTDKRVSVSGVATKYRKSYMPI